MYVLRCIRIAHVAWSRDINMDTLTSNKKFHGLRVWLSRAQLSQLSSQIIVFLVPFNCNPVELYIPSFLNIIRQISLRVIEFYTIQQRRVFECLSNNKDRWRAEYRWAKEETLRERERERRQSKRRKPFTTKTEVCYIYRASVLNYVIVTIAAAPSRRSSRDFLARQSRRFRHVLALGVGLFGCLCSKCPSLTVERLSPAGSVFVPRWTP